MIATIDLLKKAGCSSIKVLVLVAAPEGIAALEKAHPDVELYTASIDQGLNEHGYIIPGLGDAGVGEQLGGLGRKLTKGAGLVGVAGILNLVEQLGQDDGAHDGVVIGVLVTKDKNVCHGYPPLDMCTWT